MTSEKLVKDVSQQHVPPCFQMKDLKSCNLYENTIQDLQLHFASGKLTSVDYVRYCIERVEKVCRSTLCPRSRYLFLLLLGVSEYWVIHR